MLRGNSVLENSLLLGNGINRCLISNVAWGDLLNNLANEYGVECSRKLSFPLEFECIANQILERDSQAGELLYHELKENIIAQIKGCVLPSTNPHVALSSLPVSSILTTNYEYLIEQSIEKSFSASQVKRKNGDRYNLRSANLVNGISVYHIHGEMKYVDSLCLGYEHYSGTLQNLRANYAATDKKTDQLKIQSILTELPIQNIWSDKIFLDNIDIIGFGLSQSEIDIWWLLTYRAYLFFTNKKGLAKFINNIIVFHHVSPSIDENMKYALEKLHVVYAFHKIKDNSNEAYFKGYIEVAQQLKETYSLRQQ